MSKVRKYLVPLTVAAVVGEIAYFTIYVDQKKHERLNVSPAELERAKRWRPPSRKDLVERLSSHNSRDRELDVLIIGGGATGAGCAVDAALRGLKVACVDRDDWSSGTSSKSTKLVHGGVRYLEKAVLNMDMDQYKLVEEALQERATVLKIAPHLTHQMPIMLPIYQWYKIPYFWAGSKAYDLVAGRAGLHNSYFMSKHDALDRFPLLKSDGLAGAMVYYDGMQNDARVNISLILTALYHGAIATNYTKVVDLLKDERTGQLIGAVLQDSITGRRYPVYAKCIVNATGPFCDTIRRIDDGNAPLLVQPSAGTHIILPKYISPHKMGLIDPETSDGRVLFLLPWEGAVISGTTDVPSEVTFSPKATDEEIDFIVGELQRYLSPEVKVTRQEVQAAWSGLRPLVKPPTQINATGQKTESLVRSHYIDMSEAGLVTIAGGKWTTYRNMAKETLDYVCTHFHFQPPNAHQADTSRSMLIGAHGYHELLYLNLIQQHGLDEDIARHLAQNYGDRALLVVSLIDRSTSPTTSSSHSSSSPSSSSSISSSVSSSPSHPTAQHRLHPRYPYIDAEIRYACRYEFAETLVDVLARRTRLAFVDVSASLAATAHVLQIMAEEKHWSIVEQQRQMALWMEYLKTMGSEEIVGSNAVKREKET